MYVEEKDVQMPSELWKKKFQDLAARRVERQRPRTELRELSPESGEGDMWSKWHHISVEPP